MSEFRIACVGASICCGQTTTQFGLEFHPFVETTIEILEKNHIKCQQPPEIIGEPGLFTWQILSRMRSKFASIRRSVVAKNSNKCKEDTSSTDAADQNQPASKPASGFSKFLSALKCRLVPVKQQQQPPASSIAEDADEASTSQMGSSPQLFDMVCILAGTNNLSEGATAVEPAIQDVVKMVQLAEEALAMPVLITLPGIEEPWGPDHHLSRLIYNSILLAIADASCTGGESSPASTRTPIASVDLWRATGTVQPATAPKPKKLSKQFKNDSIDAMTAIWNNSVAPVFGFEHYKIEDHIEELLLVGGDESCCLGASTTSSHDGGPDATADDNTEDLDPFKREIFLNRQYSSDGLHMSKQGYELLGNLVAQLLVPKSAA